MTITSLPQLLPIKLSSPWSNAVLVLLTFHTVGALYYSPKLNYPHRLDRLLHAEVAIQSSPDNKCYLICYLYIAILPKFLLHFLSLLSRRDFHSSKLHPAVMKMVPPWIKRSPLQEGEKALTVLRRRVSSHPASFTQTSYSAPDSSATAHIPVVPQPSLVSSHRKPISKASTLSILPLNSIIRSLLVTTISSSKVCLAIIDALSLLMLHRYSSDPP